jgi:hypothetical protein
MPYAYKKFILKENSAQPDCIDAPPLATKRGRAIGEVELPGAGARAGRTEPSSAWPVA